MCSHSNECSFPRGCCVEDIGIQDVKGCARYADMRCECPGCAGKLYIRDDGKVKCGRCMMEWEDSTELEAAIEEAA